MSDGLRRWVMSAANPVEMMARADFALIATTPPILARRILDSPPQEKGDAPAGPLIVLSPAISGGGSTPPVNVPLDEYERADYCKVCDVRPIVGLYCRVCDSTP